MRTWLNISGISADAQHVSIYFFVKRFETTQAVVHYTIKVRNIGPLGENARRFPQTRI